MRESRHPGVPALRNSLGVIPIDESEVRSSISVGIRSIELFADGFMMSIDIAILDGRTFELESLEFAGNAPTYLVMAVTDDRSRSYAYAERHMRANDRSMTLDYACWPPLENDVKALHIVAERVGLRRARDKNHVVEAAWRGPWSFQVGHLVSGVDRPGGLKPINTSSQRTNVRITFVSLDRNPALPVLRLRVESTDGSQLGEHPNGRLEPVVRALDDHGVTYRGAIVSGTGSSGSWELDVALAPADRLSQATRLTIEVPEIRIHSGTAGRTKSALLAGPWSTEFAM